MTEENTCTLAKLLEDIERIASYSLNGTSLQQKAQRFDLIRDKARAALALSRPESK